MNASVPTPQCRMSSFEALLTTRGQWKIDLAKPGNVLCPVTGCDASIAWMDWARANHLRAHLRAGWLPPERRHP